MLSDREKDEIQRCVDAMRAGVDGFRTRPPQSKMMATVAHVLARCRQEDSTDHGCGHVGVVEAGTGTGKSFGALVPALVMARSRGKRLVVSSSTVALQLQYAEKDVPVLQRVLPMGFTFAVAKGRRRYVCVEGSPLRLQPPVNETWNSSRRAVTGPLRRRRASGDARW